MRWTRSAHRLSWALVLGQHQSMMASRGQWAFARHAQVGGPVSLPASRPDLLAHTHDALLALGFHGANPVFDAEEGGSANGDGTGDSGVI